MTTDAGESGGNVASSLAAQKTIARQYGLAARWAGGRENLEDRFPLNANFLVVCNGIGVVRLGFRGPEHGDAEKALARAIKKGRVPCSVPIEKYGELAVIPNPLPTREELEQQQT